MTPDDERSLAAAVREAGLESAGLDDEDFQLLWAAKYRTADRLRGATWKGLNQAGLKAGVVDAILAILASGAAAGPGPGSSAGAGVRVPNPEAKARERVIASYAVTGKDRKHIYTPMLERILVTYCHGSHAVWKVGEEIEVLVNDSTCDKQRLVKGRVLGMHPDQQVLFCSTAEPINAPNLDISVRAGEPYIMLGCSNTSQGQPFSISHGAISTTTPDRNGFIRGDTASLPGESGGGCFSAETGKLIAVNVAADAKNGNRAVLLSVAALLSLLRGHHIEVQKLMPDFMQDGGEFMSLE